MSQMPKAPPKRRSRHDERHPIVARIKRDPRFIYFVDGEGNVRSARRATRRGPRRAFQP